MKHQTEGEAKMSEDVYLSPSPAAVILGLSAARVRELVDEGELPALKTGAGARLILRSEVVRLAEKRRQHRASVERRAGADAR
jgi:excisionase family DNA binding protein